MGAGVLVYSGFTSEPGFGPRVKLGFVPSIRWPWMHVELDAAWMHQMVRPAKSVSVDAIPVSASLCLSRDVMSFCGGVTTTFFSTLPGDDMRRTIAALLAVVTEFPIAGPLSVRVEAFANMRLAEQSIGALWNGIREQDILTSGGALAAVWSWL